MVGEVPAPDEHSCIRRPDPPGRRGRAGTTLKRVTPDPPAVRIPRPEQNYRHMAPSRPSSDRAPCSIWSIVTNCSRAAPIIAPLRPCSPGTTRGGRAARWSAYWRWRMSAPVRPNWLRLSMPTSTPASCRPRQQSPCLTHAWDNTPRPGHSGVVLDGATPELFRKTVNDAMTLSTQ